MTSLPVTRRALLQAGGMAALGTLCRPLFAERKRYDVIIIGAGLAGLQAGRILHKHGVDFLLLEASQRVGGRVYTLDDLPGRPEAGATQSGAKYHALNQVIEELGIKTGNIRPGAPGMTLLVNGHLDALENWPASAGNRLPETLKDTPPYGLLPKLLRNGSFLARPLDWWKPENSVMDIPLQTYLKQLGADEEAIRLVDANLNGESIRTLSALDLLRKLAVLQAAGAPRNIGGGSQRLPDAMQASIGQAALLGKQVTTIRQAKTALELITSDADRFTCRFCLVAVPFSVLRHIRIEDPLSQVKQQAIGEMGYTPVTHVLMRPGRPFWLDDGFSPNIWTDTDLGRVFTETGEQGEVIRLRAWIQGSKAQGLSGLTDRELGAHTVALLERARPAAKSQLEVEGVISWGKTLSPAARFPITWPAASINSAARSANRRACCILSARIPNLPLPVWRPPSVRATGEPWRWLSGCPGHEEGIIWRIPPSPGTDFKSVPLTQAD